MEEMRTVCKENMCMGCGACINKCHKAAISICDTLDAYNAVIDPTLCVNCGQCEQVCPNNEPIQAVAPILWQQGWATDTKVRENASSGGVASALAISIVEAGGVCCLCNFRDGNFGFSFAQTVADILTLSGSKYVKSNPTGAYREIRRYLSEGKKVLFIGLPCQVAGVKKYIGDSDLLYTVDLICHGTPSPQLLRMFLSEKGRDVKAFHNIKFRKKANFYVSDQYEGVDPPSVRDRYTLAFLRSLDYTENCYHCQYACVERCSDITLGDSWGSTLPQSEIDRGVSLVLAMTEKGTGLLEQSALHLEAVDRDRAIEYNRQLKHPSVRPADREAFFFRLKRDHRFDRAVASVYRKVCFRQSIKAFLIRMKIIKKSF